MPEIHPATTMESGRRFKVGVTIHPQQCTIAELRDAWRTANVSASSPNEINEWLEAGLQHLVLRLAKPFDTKQLERVLKASRA